MTSTIKITDDHFHIEHQISNPFVMVIGITTYKGNWRSNGWKPLKGVKEDIWRMKDLFQDKLKYDTKIITYTKYKNCSKRDILNFIKKECVNTVDDDELKEPYDALICIVSGHGVTGSFVSGDGHFININSNLFVKFNADSIDKLGNYPKIFLFDTCRGDTPPHIVHKMKNVKGHELVSTNVEAGFRISYATTPGKPTQDLDDGGAFITAFYETMIYLYGNKILDTIDFQSILRMSSQKATVKNTENLHSPVHEDYTIYKIFFNCKDKYYKDDINVDIDKNDDKEEKEEKEETIILRQLSLKKYNDIKTENWESFRLESMLKYEQNNAHNEQHETESKCMRKLKRVCGRRDESFCCQCVVL